MSLSAVLFVVVLQYADGCGSLTHMLISGRAREYYHASDQNTDYRKLFEKHRDALQAGSSYPDSFYDGLCGGGAYHNVSEDTHWTPFINASVNYIRRKYPHPWNLETEKLVVFLFGILSHQVADIVWHSLGMSQGFLPTMGKVNFHGDYTTAHKFGDLGGEWVSLVDLDVDLVISLKEWYIPSLDLYNIYQEFYGTTRISLLDIELCSAQLFIEGIAESLSKFEVYLGVVDRSPFLVQEMENYFLGGVNDMVGWTQRSWNNLVTMLDRGTHICNLTYNPVFVTCNTTGKQQINNDDNKVKNGYYIARGKHGLMLEDLKVTRTSRGISIEPGQQLHKLIDNRKQEIIALKKKIFTEKSEDKGRNDIRVSKFMVSGSYARFGWSIASDDIDGDGYKDSVIGSPGYSQINNWQRGRVYIVYGSESTSGLSEFVSFNLDTPDVDLLNTTFIDGPDKMQSRFGSSVAILDVNWDGLLDIAVGSPAFWNNSPLDYNGLVSIYLGQKKTRRLYNKPDVLITCKTIYCNLGTTLTGSDIRNNGLLDLVIGAPFYDSKYEQSGIVTALMSSKDVKANQKYDFEDLIKRWKLLPDQQQPYAWFGHGVKSKDTVLIISSPNYRKCYYSNCSYSEHDVQCVGQTQVFSHWSGISNFTITGIFEYDSNGYDMDLGYPYGTESGLIVAVSIPGHNVVGRLKNSKENIYRAGSVVLVNCTGGFNVIAEFDGNRRYARFGHVIKFFDMNNDDISDMIISEPNRIKDRSELTTHFKNGRFYIFYGGYKMPRGNATFSAKCNEEQPCPSNIANYTSSTFNEQGNNGFVIDTYYTESGVVILSSDVTSDAGFYSSGAGRRSGVVWKYLFKI